jgi:hypothetical protein
VKRLRVVALQNAAPLNEADEHHDDGYHEQHVNEASHGGTGHQSEKPQNNEDNGDSHEHKKCPF